MSPTTTPTIYLDSKVTAWEPSAHPFEHGVAEQTNTIARYPFVHKMCLMPDAHVGRGATVGSVIATRKAVVPSAVGVDIGCGMIAIQLSLKASDLPEDLSKIRHSIERQIPMGTGEGYKNIPKEAEKEYEALAPTLGIIHDKTKIDPRRALAQLGTLGAGNHFIELCIDEGDNVWLMLHSGSRGIGNQIGQYYISAAYKEIEKTGQRVGRDYAWLSEGTDLYNDYCQAVAWAQQYAKVNRFVIVNRIVADLRNSKELPKFTLVNEAVHCHHNYISWETHDGIELIVTRKGAISATVGQLGIIPGSMGTKSYIVEGLGSQESMTSASHGAGRRYSRSKAKELYTSKDLREATDGVECRKDKDVVDEIPYAYKDLDSVMEAQKDLVSIKHTLKATLCCKG